MRMLGSRKCTSACRVAHEVIRSSGLEQGLHSCLGNVHQTRLNSCSIVSSHAVPLSPIHQLVARTQVQSAVHSA